MSDRDILATYYRLMRHAYERQLENTSDDCLRAGGVCCVACAELGCVRYHYGVVKAALEKKEGE